MGKYGHLVCGGWSSGIGCGDWDGSSVAGFDEESEERAGSD